MGVLPTLTSTSVPGTLDIAAVEQDHINDDGGKSRKIEAVRDGEVRSQKQGRRRIPACCVEGESRGVEDRCDVEPVRSTKAIAIGFFARCVPRQTSQTTRRW